MERGQAERGQAERGLAAAVATGWIETEAPPGLQDTLLNGVDTWLAATDPPERLWLGILTLLRDGIHRDAELSACRMALDLLPGQPWLRFRLAEALHLAGDDDQALAELDRLAAMAAVDGAWHMLRLAVLAERPERLAPAVDAAAAFLLGQGEWTARHAAFIRWLVAATGDEERAGAFLRDCLEGFGFPPERLPEMAHLAMLTGQPALARRFYQPLWAAAEPGADLLIGRHGGEAADDDDDARLLGRIEAAFALPEPERPAAALPDADPPPAGLRLVFAGFEKTRMPNDLAHHFLASGRDAGLDIVPWLDNALILASEMRSGDEAIAARIEAFAAAMERLRPDVVMLDWAGMLCGRGLDPERMAAIRQRCGFRLVVIIRDAHARAAADIRMWLPVSDAMLLFHPLAGELAGTRNPDPRLLAVPVPVQYHRPERPAPPDLNLLFIGAVNYPLRQAMLAVLLTEPVPVTVVTGRRRAAEAPDMAAYWRLLGRARALLNVSAHTPEEHLVTGRVWEAIAAGTLLVEQANPATAQFLVPWRHYLPWESFDDIIRIARFVERRPDQAARVAAEAGRWVGRHYDSRRFWAAVIAQAFRFAPSSM